jgi:photosystem II stability/assembly factor-like uncharacterized protein
MNGGQMIRNTKRLFFLSVFLVSVTSVSNGQWIDIDSPVTTTLRDVCFADSLNGWAVGDTSTIIHTSDGGYNWVTQNCPISNFNLGRVQFIDNNIGFITANKGIVLKTSNGGMNWNPIIIDTLFNYGGLCFLDPDTGWVVGGGNTFPTRTYGVIIRTTNGGNTWTKQYETDSSMFPVEDNFNDIKFINALDGYAVTGIGGTFLYTTNNGGITWNRKGFSGLPLYYIDIVSKDTVWGCGGGFASTVDDGLNWIYNAVLGGNVLDLSMINANSGYVLAARFEQQKLMFTVDRGETFTDTWIYQGATLLAMHIDDDINFICAVGASGRIVINKNFITGLNDHELEYIQGFTLYQNYPNPFNPSTIIKYQIYPDVGGDLPYVQMDIYDMLGNKIKSLVNKYQAPGVYEVYFDGRGICSSVYMYLLKVNNFFKSKKMIFAK